MTLKDNFESKSKDQYHPTPQEQGKYDAIVRWIDRQEEDISLNEMSFFLDLKPLTLPARVRRGELDAKKVGNNNYVTKETAHHLVEQHKYAVYGWVQRTQVAEELDIYPNLMHPSVENSAIRVEYDLVGKIRVAPETVTYLQRRKEIQNPENGWLRRQDFAKKMGIDPISVSNLCNAQGFEVEKDLKGDLRISPSAQEYIRQRKKESEKISDWVERSKFSKEMGFSKNAISNICNAQSLEMKKDLKGHWRVSPEAQRYIVSIKDEISPKNNLIERCQNKLMRPFLSDPYKNASKLEGISDIDSFFWKAQVRILRNKGGDYSRLSYKKKITKERYIASSTGWSLERVRATKAIAKNRKKVLLSLDKKLNYETNDTFLDLLPDETLDTVSDADSIFQVADIRSDISQILTPEEQSIIARMYGIGGLQTQSEYDSLPQEELDQKVQAIFAKLKVRLEKYSQ
jgi:hypothetical protein